MLKWRSFGKQQNAMRMTKSLSLPSFSLTAFLLLVLMSQMSLASMCFSDPKSAYQHLLRQESLTEQTVKSVVVNINTATEAELVSLHGIGSSKAQAIILYREMFGNFNSVDDLAKVKGIGAKTIEKNRSRLQAR